MKQLLPISHKTLVAKSLCFLMVGAFVVTANGQSSVGKPKTTSLVLDATKVEAAAAITSLFGEPYYRGMIVIELSPTVKEYGLTNGWDAHPSTSELTEITKGKKTLPYFAEFHITAEPLGSNQCKIDVRTLKSWIHDGKEIGVHGGMAHHAVDVPPVLQEETNLLSQIARELRWIKEGRTNMASTNAPPKRADAGPGGMYGEEKTAFEAALKSVQNLEAKSARTTNNNQQTPPQH